MSVQQRSSVDDDMPIVVGAALIVLAMWLIAAAMV